KLANRSSLQISKMACCSTSVSLLAGVGLTASGRLSARIPSASRQRCNVRRDKPMMSQALCFLAPELTASSTSET
ncbi:hypothetical protein, partial [Alteromonas mediterranea]|uniref:hypothetical protein n=1 Tax=Alteromonas mediterranea TaxID=314275 RepID=UPI003A5BFD1F